VRRRHHPRGTKRGRPRGSTRRGGGHGTLQRVSTPTSPAIGTGTVTGMGTGLATSSPLPQQEAGNIEAASGLFVPQHDEGKWQVCCSLISFLNRNWKREGKETQVSLCRLIAVIITFIACLFYMLTQNRHTHTHMHTCTSVFAASSVTIGGT